MISTSVPTVPVVPHIPFIPFVLKIPAVLSVSFVSDVSRELICTGRTSCTLGTDDTLDTFGVKTGFYGTEEIFGAKNSLLWYATHLLMRFVLRKRFRWCKISVLYGVVVGSRRLSDVDCVSEGIGGTENLV